MTDHMLIMTFEPSSGWSAPAIRPYGPLSLDPASSCFQYCPNLFEGMKVFPWPQYKHNNLNKFSQAYLGPDGTPRLFRPDLNMARMIRSTARVALPVNIILPGVRVNPQLRDWYPASAVIQCQFALVFN